ncbi:hypothetical protein [Photobacterium profundum]|uniref:Uncharacterized protein n=1 Tax=Photobacterium profundum 3TCK TaxID=314280 RepID=Q1Z2S9_9GAMM|nr:hypothetical protein [Photobacterium profundum]EAS42838.1 hypothetical protein P3TCK_08296 [Photobacterium profundum 3TCK]
MEEYDFSEFMDKLSKLDKQQRRQVYLKTKESHDVESVNVINQILTDEELDMLLM